MSLFREGAQRLAGRVLLRAMPLLAVENDVLTSRLGLTNMQNLVLSINGVIRHVIQHCTLALGRYCLIIGHQFRAGKHCE